MDKLSIINPVLQKGQALITLLFYVIIVVTISTAAVIMLIINTTSASKLQEGIVAYYVAESGAEEALLRVLRNPAYTGTGYNGEPPLTVGDGTATITVVPGSPTTITSTGRVGNFVRIVQVTANYTGGYYTISSWEEIQ